MKIIPAIDIRDGKCVRLKKGDFDSFVVYDDDPVRVAEKWIEEGAQYIQVIDLDAAKQGRLANRRVIAGIGKLAGAVFQYGGGVRTDSDLQDLFSYGYSNIIVGTSLIENESQVKKWLAKYGSALRISLDGKGDTAVMNGWTKRSGLPIPELITKSERLGFRSCIYTDTNRDGMMTGIKREYVCDLLKRTKMEMIIAGGIDNGEDIRWLKRNGAAGAVIGTALYEKKLQLKEVLALC